MKHPGKCRCCGRAIYRRERMCSLCRQECTNEGCVVSNWLPVEDDEESA